MRLCEGSRFRILVLNIFLIAEISPNSQSDAICQLMDPFQSVIEFTPPWDEMKIKIRIIKTIFYYDFVFIFDLSILKSYFSYTKSYNLI